MNLSILPNNFHFSGLAKDNNLLASGMLNTTFLLFWVFTDSLITADVDNSLYLTAVPKGDTREEYKGNWLTYPLLKHKLHINIGLVCFVITNVLNICIDFTKSNISLFQWLTALQHLVD